jgi:hypothetical protein
MNIDDFVPGTVYEEPWMKGDNVFFVVSVVFENETRMICSVLCGTEFITVPMPIGYINEVLLLAKYD